MGKVYCDFCGAAFQDTEAKCPICGFARDMGENTVQEDILLEEDIDLLEEAVLPKRKNKPIFDYDEVNADEDDESDDEDEDDDELDEEDDDEEPRSNTALIVILVIVITLLLLATGFVFFRYFLPNVMGTEETTQMTTEATTQAAEESTVPTVPCKMLAMTSENPQLSQEGQPWLLHVTVTPENTTDELIYVSEDESIVTVSEDGKIVAVGEGETVVKIICGDQMIKCPVVVDYSLAVEESTEEGVPTMGVNDVQEASAPTDAADAAEETESNQETQAATEETESTEPVLKLKEVDISLSKVRGITYELTLDCDIPADEIEWITMDSNVLLVKNGVISVMGPGTTKVVAKYNGQSVECIVRCIF